MRRPGDHKERLTSHNKRGLAVPPPKEKVKKARTASGGGPDDSLLENRWAYREFELLRQAGRESRLRAWQPSRRVMSQKSAGQKKDDSREGKREPHSASA